MTFNINAFKADGFQFDGARPALFEVTLSAPPNVGSSILPRSRFLVKAATLPASFVDYIDVGYFGRKIKVHGDRVFQDWQITIINDEDFALRAMFEAWSNKMNTHISNRYDPALSVRDYKQDLQITQFTKKGEIARSYNIVGAFPTQISDIVMDWDSQNQIEYFDVRLAYDYWEPLEQNSASRTKLYDRYDSQLPGDGVALRDPGSNI
jgi:hypothetical protein